ncbi:R3H domain [Trypanosoma vivax]|uniref:R3H domain-containing protein n=1 Tax=Trypanosoma vivax (strain Y486) TaxID=1055687 RepID=G0UD86_TRYVY|nr:hypothetical protein TRVL_00552 [Trypanosoma vivax]KAH8608993.1 R3H domain [Trypanosoma vivax]CCC53797.1 conserved hypothetical protein [Trypanosoma vivax Y486]
MASTGSREEMMDALLKARQAMASRVRAAAEVPGQETATSAGALQLHDVAKSLGRPASQMSEARENRGHFFDTWSQKIKMFIADPTKTVLELPSDLCANDRRELHGLAEAYNLSHHSHGTGASRRLVLKKDSLHYRMPDAAPVDVESLKKSSGEKQSKFHLRRVRQDPGAAAGSLGAFGDEATAEKVSRLVRATDEYRRAVEVGYSQEELLAIEDGCTVERLLCSGPNEWHAPQESGQDVVSPANSAPGAPRLCPPATQKAQTSAAGKRAASYDEVCLRCGSRARVNYDVQKWECNGYCAKCAMQTIWKLVEVSGDSTTTAGAGHKRDRSDADVGPPIKEPEPEEIDKDNDEDDALTVDDVVDMASMNDFCAADVNWIRRFAEHHQSRGKSDGVSAHLVFCIEFEDLLSMRIFRKFIAAPETTQIAGGSDKVKSENAAATVPSSEPHETWFVRLCEAKSAGVVLATLLEELSTSIPGGYDRLSIAFPNASVYGTATSCICLVHPGELQTEIFGAMQRKYGTQSVFCARDLRSVLACDKGPA